MKTDVAELKTDVASIKKDVKKLKNDVTGLLDWRKKVINAQEERTASVVENTLLTHCNTCVVKRLDLKIFYDTSGREITDFDSCFLVTPEVPVPSRKHSTREEKRLASTINRINSVSSTIAKPYLVLIENKTTIDKKIIDTKLKQHGVIKTNIESSRGNTTGFHKKFVSMVNTHGVDRYPDLVYLVFACDSMSYAIKEYISLINRGITRQEYESASVDLVREDRTYKEICRTRHGKRLSEASSFADIKQAVQDLHTLGINGSLHLLDSIADYDDIKDAFDSVKGLLGHIVQDKLTIDAVVSFV